MAEATEATVESVLLIPWEATEATEAATVEATEAAMAEATEATVESVLLIPWEATEATAEATVEATEAAMAEATEAAIAEATANKPILDNCRVKLVLSNVVSLLRVRFCYPTLRCSSAINGSKCANILRLASVHQWRAS